MNLLTSSDSPDINPSNNNTRQVRQLTLYKKKRCVVLVCVRSFVSISSDNCLNFLCLGMFEIMTVLFLSSLFLLLTQVSLQGTQVKKHDAYERLMPTTVPDKKVTGNNWTYIKKKKARRKEL